MQLRHQKTSCEEEMSGDEREAGKRQQHSSLSHKLSLYFFLLVLINSHYHSQKERGRKNGREMCLSEIQQT